MIRSLRNAVRAIPGAPRFYQILQGIQIKNKTTQEVFTDIFHKNSWNGLESISGPGSSIESAERLIAELPILWENLGVKKVLDIPCGDFNWMSQVDLRRVDYLGADIVDELIRNNVKDERSNVHFRRMDVISEPLPTVDLILCRDCLGHLSFQHGIAALRNICRSNSRYLLVSTSDKDKNHDIVTGQGRDGGLNLQIPPFSLPPPISTIEERYRGSGGKFKTSLGLWRVEDIAKSVGM
jgi:hypothetical protein